MEKIHTQSFWVYGVIVGLAIREALSRTIPGIVSSNPDPGWFVRLETWRLLIFLTMIIRFYLGSSLFFNKAYIDPVSSPKFQKKSYGLDFICGLVIFMIFFGWSITIGDKTRLSHGMSNFLLLLTVILAYDFVWFIVNLRYDTVHSIKLWMAINILTFVFAAVIFFAIREIRSNDVLAEELAFIPVALFSYGDFVEMISNNRVFSGFFSWLNVPDPDKLNHNKATSKDQENPGN
jgi:hypothetical protein